MGTQFGFTSRELMNSDRICKDSFTVLKAWQNETNNPKLSDEQLALFLIACQGDIELSKRTIETYIAVKSTAPEIFTGWNITNANLRRMLSVINVAIIPKRYLNSAIAIACIKDTDYQNFSFSSFCQLCFMIVEAIVIENPPEDVILVADLKGISYGHLTIVEMKHLKALLEYAQYGMPLRIKMIHVLNANYLVYSGYSMFEMFSHANEPSKVKFYSEGDNLQTLQNSYVPKSYLPRDYGGDLDPLLAYQEETVAKLSMMQYHFDSLQKQFF